MQHTTLVHVMFCTTVLLWPATQLEVKCQICMWLNNKKSTQVHLIGNRSAIFPPCLTYAKVRVSTWESEQHVAAAAVNAFWGVGSSRPTCACRRRLKKHFLGDCRLSRRRRRRRAGDRSTSVRTWEGGRENGRRSDRIA